MNKDEISGKVDQVVGKVKQGVGEAIGNQKVANQGVIDQAKGAAKETWATQRMRQTRYVSRTGGPRRRKPITFATISANPWQMPRRMLKPRSLNLKTVTLKRRDSCSYFPAGFIQRCESCGWYKPRFNYAEVVELNSERIVSAKSGLNSSCRRGV